MLGETNRQADGLAFGLLGPLQVDRDGTVLPLGGRQQRAVLGLLLAEAGNVVSQARIADELWGERLPAGHAATVQTYVFHLREVLEPDRERGTPARILVTEPGGYRLRAEDGMLDANTFKQQTQVGNEHLARGELAEAAATLTEALSLWRGEVLADLADFKFVAPLAAELDQARRAALTSRIEAELALGHHTALLSELEQLTSRYPLDEDLYAARILALYRAGRPSDALDAYRAVRTELRDELGVEPGPRLQQLHHQVLTHDPSLDWSTPPSGDGHRRGARATAAEAATPRRMRSHRRRWVVGAAAIAVLATASGIAAVVVTHTPKHSLAALPGDSVGAIHSDGTLHDAVQVGTSPDAVAYGAGALWIANAADGTVTRVDPRRDAVVQTIPVGAQPAAITVAGQDVWVADHGDSTVYRINARSDTVTEKITVGSEPDAITSGSTGVWVANRGNDTIQRIDPGTGKASGPTQVDGSPDGMAVDGDTVWLTDAQDSTVTQLDART